jgi:hypothetical protein
MMAALEQRDLWGLLPGAAGGRALRDQRKRPYFGDLGALGGQATIARYGREHMRELARRSAARKRQRRDTQPRTIQYIEVGQVVIERVIPYWPHQPRRRHRKAPLLVRIELACISPVARAKNVIGGG